MKRIADFLVDRRHIMLAAVLVAAAVCALLIPTLETNRDMTKYLPEDSNMRRGMALMEDAFPAEAEPASIRVMFTGLDDAEAKDIKEQLEDIRYVSSVAYEPEDESCNKDDYRLFTVKSTYDYGTDQEAAVEDAIARGFAGYEMVYQNDDVQPTKVTARLLAGAIALALVILVIMSASWLEPVLFAAAIGTAIVINLGTNAALPYTSELTASIGPIIQLALSMDYSIILMDRYRQKKAACPDKLQAMKNALRGAFSSIASSALTTAVGLLALVFLSFRLGPELGVVLAKGVFLSMLCVFTVLPALILACDKAIEKSRKRTPHVPMGLAARFSYKARYVMPFLFVGMFAAFYILQGETAITFTEGTADPIAQIFPRDNPVVLLYDESDEAGAGDLLAELEGEAHVKSATGYANTLGLRYTSEEMTDALEAAGDADLDGSLVGAVYAAYFGGSDLDEMGSAEMAALFSAEPPEDGDEQTMTIPEFLDYLCDDVMESDTFADYFDEDTRAALEDARAELDEAAAQLRSGGYGRLIVTTDLPDESAETTAFMEKLDSLREEHLKKASYLVGTSAMVHEMEGGFRDEYTAITRITAAAIFLVVLLTFRNLAVPALLTLLVQCGVYITVTVIGRYSGSMYYLALLIVQSILMGATIDYGIVFSGFYRENRKRLDRPDALKAAYDGSIHTIMTSGSILVLVLAVLGVFSTSFVSQVCVTLSIGALVAILLILFVLPAVLTCLDQFTARSSSSR